MADTRPPPGWPLAVSYGLGVNSTALLDEFARRGVRPDLVLFADTGGEKLETYDYLPVIQQFLRKEGFPPVEVVRYEPVTAPYRTLEGQCLHTRTLPSLAYGGKSCSLKYKRTPQDKLILARYPPATLAAQGGRVARSIGFDSTEGRRTCAGVAKVVGLDAGEGHRLTWKEPPKGGGRRPSREAWARRTRLPLPVPANGVGDGPGRLRAVDPPGRAAGAAQVRLLLLPCEQEARDPGTPGAAPGPARARPGGRAGRGAGADQWYAPLGLVQVL